MKQLLFITPELPHPAQTPANLAAIYKRNIPRNVPGQSYE